MKYYILFGPPGAGKGTQAKLISKEFNLLHVSTGELLRKEIAEGTELGIMAQQIISEGHLVPDDIVVGMIEHIFSTAEGVNGFLLDGFPRTINQAKMLDKMLKEDEHAKVDKVISLIISDATIFERIGKRAEVEGREDDAASAIIKNRIDTYHTQTEPLIEYYKEQGKYYPIEGERSIEEVFESACALIKE